MAAASPTRRSSAIYQSLFASPEARSYASVLVQGASHCRSPPARSVRGRKRSDGIAARSFTTFPSLHQKKWKVVRDPSGRQRLYDSEVDTEGGPHGGPAEREVVTGDEHETFAPINQRRRPESLVGTLVPPNLPLPQSLPLPVAREIVGLVGDELGLQNAEMDASICQMLSIDETREKETARKVRAALRKSRSTASELRQLSSSILLHSPSPFRQAVSLRLYALAYGDAMLTDVLRSSSGPIRNSGRRSGTVGAKGKGAKSTSMNGRGWGDDDAGYSWASMILHGAVGDDPVMTERAISVLTALSKRGNSHGHFGLGRVLAARLEGDYMARMAELQSEASAGLEPSPFQRPGEEIALGEGGGSGAGPGAHLQGPSSLEKGKGRAMEQDAEGRESVKKTTRLSERERRMMADRVERLLNLASLAGVGEASTELGKLYRQGRYIPKDIWKARECFERGARQDNASAHFQLATLLASTSSGPAPGFRSPIASDPSLSLRHFLRAAKLGHAEAAHNLGRLYLFDPSDPSMSRVGEGDQMLIETMDEAGERTFVPSAKAKVAHKMKFGVTPDDVAAREWFAEAARRGQVRSMIVLAGMILDRRGRAESTSMRSGGGKEVREERRRERKCELEDAKKWLETALLVVDKGGGGKMPEELRRKIGEDLSRVDGMIETLQREGDDETGINSGTRRRGGCVCLVM